MRVKNYPPKIFIQLINFSISDQYLNTVDITHDRNYENFRLPVQYVVRPNLDFRGFCGTIAAGEISVGDEIVTLPSGKESKVKEIVTYDANLESACLLLHHHDSNDKDNDDKRRMRLHEKNLHGETPLYLSQHNAHVDRALYKRAAMVESLAPHLSSSLLQR